jgi:hypothetical protein
VVFFDPFIIYFILYFLILLFVSFLVTLFIAFFIIPFLHRVTVMKYAVLPRFVHIVKLLYNL